MTNYLYFQLNINTPHLTPLSEELTKEIVTACIAKSTDVSKQCNSAIRNSIVFEVIEGKTLNSHYQPDKNNKDTKGPYPVPDAATAKKNWHILGAMAVADLLVLNIDRFGLFKEGKTNADFDNAGNFYITTPGIYYAIDNSSDLSRNYARTVDKQMTMNKNLVAKYFGKETPEKLCTDLGDHLAWNTAEMASSTYVPSADHVKACAQGVSDTVVILKKTDGALSKLGIKVLMAFFLDKFGMEDKEKDIEDHVAMFFKNYVMCNRMRIGKGKEKSSSDWCADHNTKLAAAAKKAKK